MGVCCSILLSFRTYSTAVLRLKILTVTVCKGFAQDSVITLFIVRYSLQIRNILDIYLEIS